MAQNVLLTGGTGLVGADVLRRLLAGDTDLKVWALVRGSSPDTARARLRRAVELLEGARLPASSWERVRVLCGDITRQDCGLTPDIRQRLRSAVTHIVHAASDVRFDLQLDEARRVNVDGTRQLLRIARDVMERGGLKRFTYVSTAYVCGSRDGVIYEDEDITPRFSNTYEQSKFEAEQHVRAAMRDLPASILRPSIIVGDEHSGRTNAFKALYAPLRLIVRNLVRFLPCEEHTPLDVVPVDYVSRAICHLLFDDGASIGRTLHLTAGGAASSTVGDIVRGALRSGRSVDTARVEFVSPRKFNFTDITGAGERALVATLAQFAPYLAINRTFDDTGARDLLRGSGIALRPFTQYISTILRFAVDSAWGRRFALAA